MSMDDFKNMKGNPGALINPNVEALAEYKERRKKLLLEKNNNKNNDVDDLKQDVDSIKSELSELKNLLLKVLEKK